MRADSPLYASRRRSGRRSLSIPAALALGAGAAALLAILVGLAFAGSRKRARPGHASRGRRRRRPDEARGCGEARLAVQAAIAASRRLHGCHELVPVRGEPARGPAGLERRGRCRRTSRRRIRAGSWLPAAPRSRLRSGGAAAAGRIERCPRLRARQNLGGCGSPTAEREARAPRSPHPGRARPARQPARPRLRGRHDRSHARTARPTVRGSCAPGRDDDPARDGGAAGGSGGACAVGDIASRGRESCRSQLPHSEVAARPASQPAERHGNAARNRWLCGVHVLPHPHEHGRSTGPRCRVRRLWRLGSGGAREGRPRVERASGSAGDPARRYATDEPRRPARRRSRDSRAIDGRGARHGDRPPHVVVQDVLLGHLGPNHEPAARREGARRDTRGAWRHFSLNDAIGERTIERGFRSAPVIIGNEFAEEVGGGTSQVATTAFNAAWEAGLRITERHPHSLYISRYQLGRDATVYWPSLDLKFVNDTKKWVLVKGFAESDGISIAIYGGETRRIESSATPLVVTGRAPVERVDDPRSPKGKTVVEAEGSSPTRTTATRKIYPRTARSSARRLDDLVRGREPCRQGRYEGRDQARRPPRTKAPAEGKTPTGTSTTPTTPRP